MFTVSRVYLDRNMHILVILLGGASLRNQTTSFQHIRLKARVWKGLDLDTHKLASFVSVLFTPPDSATLLSS